MKFKITTLVDITETGTRRTDPDKRSYHQQSNYMTALNTIGLRANPDVDQSPQISSKSIGNLGFGNKYKGKQTIWELYFEIPFQDAVTLEMLIEDFDLVPIVNNLDETIDIKEPVFRTKSQEYTNILFEQLDK
jgi:hypothetical protein